MLKLYPTLIFCLSLAAPSSAQVYRPESFKLQSPKVISAVSELPFVDLVKITRDRESPTDPHAAAVLGSTRFNQGGDHKLYDPANGKYAVIQTSVRWLNPNPLPVAEADVVVTGAVTSATANLSADGTMVYMAYTFSPKRFIKGDGHKISGLLKLERLGGIALYPDGTKHFNGVVGMGLPETGHEYVLFLKSASADDLDITTGYCIDSGKVAALDKYGDKLSNRSASSLIEEIAHNAGNN